MIRVEPVEIQDVLANPGMGWQTFHRFADEDPNLHGIPTGAAYIRFGWKELEPEEGRIDFAQFDGLLAHARKAGQKLGFRVMIAASGGSGTRRTGFGRRAWRGGSTPRRAATASGRRTSRTRW